MIKKNNEYDVDIVDINQDGQGVGKIGSYTVFVSNVVVGERVKIKIIKQKKTYGYGKLVEIIEPSEDRVLPKCVVGDRCGGCTLLHVDYKAQLLYKKKLVKESLKRIGKLDFLVNDVIGMDNPLYYRNKAQFPVREIDQETKIGFYANNSHNVVLCDDCKIQNPKINEIKKIAEKFIKDSGIRGYNDETKKGDIRHILVRVGNKTNLAMVVLVLNKDRLENIDVLVDMLRSKVKGLASVIVNINNKNTNVILGSESRLVWGKDYIEDYIGDLKFKISAKSFYQVNTRQTEVLYNKVLEYADLKGNETVFDLYCGIGTITLTMSKKSKFVYGVEVVEDAIKNAKENARINNIKNVKFVEGKAEDIIPVMYEEGIKADIVVVDPPRKGLDKELICTLIKMKPKKIVYVSCNPSTLARDLKILGEDGFIVKEVQPVDMFPMSMHVETVCLLSKLR